jgi:hypothetical protein
MFHMKTREKIFVRLIAICSIIWACILSRDGRDSLPPTLRSLHSDTYSFDWFTRFLLACPGNPLSSVSLFDVFKKFPLLYNPLTQAFYKQLSEISLKNICFNQFHHVGIVNFAQHCPPVPHLNKSAVRYLSPYGNLFPTTAMGCSPYSCIPRVIPPRQLGITPYLELKSKSVLRESPKILHRLAA